MAILRHVGTVWDDDRITLAGVSDLSVVRVGRADFLIAAGMYDSGITAFRLDGGNLPVPVSRVTYGPGTGTLGIGQVEVISRGQDTLIVAGGRWDNNLSIYEIGRNGAVTRLRRQRDDNGSFEKFDVIVTTEFNDKTFVWASQTGQPGLTTYRLTDAGRLRPRQEIADSPDQFLGDVTAMASVVIDGVSRVFVASGLDAGIGSYRPIRVGRVRLLDTVAPGDGSGFSGITAMEVAEVEGRHFLVVGAAGSNSLTVYRITPHGRLNEMDHVIDTRDTRFGGVQDIAIVETGGRTMVLAGGADNGVTVFQLNHQGQLKLFGVVEDGFDTALGNVSSLAVHESNGKVYVLVGGMADGGVSMFELVVPPRDRLIIGTGEKAEVLRGGPGNDEIHGIGRNNELHGGAGDDWLYAGRGSDRMWGGPGADVFVLRENGKPDYIMDFELDKDRIDMTDYDGLWGIDQLTITRRPYGADIVFRDDLLEVRTMDGRPIPPGALTEDHFIFG